ncbi:jg17706 [Pararge aegeria aegeria]|uniref:Jg17706 protein n=1 Tax=Pararge aegeria aegeria TaxID=348720 RepID=A0A8S4R293_9NEOP|nr:jg17706 [Pararge aegeria aegeria]
MILDCALSLARGQADIGVFSEEEIVLLSHQQPNDNRVIATIRDVSRTEPFAFEAVAVVPATHIGGLAGLRGGRYCHPGFDQTEQRWSPRVLKTLEKAAARTDRCADATTTGKTAEEMEVETLAQFFGNACRPGPWSANDTLDADLKRRFPSLCSLCGENATCSRYTIDMGISVSGVNNNNRHIQSLECLRANNSDTAVAYVAWQHVREFFNIRSPELATSYALLCEDNTLSVLTAEVLASATAPCSLVKQPWSVIVATASQAATLQASLQSWWPNGINPGGNTWQSVLYNAIVGGSNARVAFQEGLPTPLEYTQGIRNFTTIDASTSCMPIHRWCTISPQEHAKCTWVRNAAFTMGIEPYISCQQRATTFECLADIRDNAADFMATPANYGYLSRQHYKLSSVKLVENSHSNPNSFSRVAALVKASSVESGNITRFENLRGKRACFPEFGGISYMAFVRTAHERGVISPSECDYARAVGELFDSACAPGALANSHAIADSSFNATNLCTVCRPSVAVAGESFTCAYNSTNMFYGNNGTIRCLADPANDVAFLEVQNIDQHLASANITTSSVRVLCRNNTLLDLVAGVEIDPNCLLAFVVDSEVLARRNDALTNSLNTLLDTLDFYFGYNTPPSAQLVNLKIYSPFDGRNDLLFLNTAIGLTEPSSIAANTQARNYNELFRHLESCTGAAAPGLANRNFFSIMTLILMGVITRFVVY